MKKLLFLTILLSVISFAFSQSPIDIFTKNSQLQHANISIQVKDANSGKMLYQHRADKSEIPASTMKLVTTATALEMFGADFKFRTALAYDGQIVADSILHGNLYIVGGGDATLGSAKTGEQNFLDNWVNAIRAAGIKTIDGQILTDETIFDSQAANPRWTWEDMGNAYAPSIHGISYLDNTLKVIFKSGAVGTTPEILRTEPTIEGMTFSNYLKSTTVTYDKGYFYGEPFSNHRTIYGEIPANRAEFTVKSDLPHPAATLVNDLQKTLINQGFTIKNNSLSASEKHTFYTHFSPTLAEIIAETNTKSNNHYAEYLFRQIGTRAGTPATIDGSLKTIRDFWQTRGVSVAGLFQCDGSGLSPSNAVSAEFFVALLDYMQTKSRNYSVFYASLAVAGESGTLEPLLRKSVLKGKVHAKSGTLTRVKSYAGYVDYKDKSLIFAIIVNNYNNSSYDIIKLVEEFLISVSDNNK
jgi:D-alanyl-D-alanine carboxypeptidase/D-alanyl-D-alanine-endopeptidase (penicillin-binding protein 4)